MIKKFNMHILLWYNNFQAPVQYTTRERRIRVDSQLLSTSSLFTSCRVPRPPSRGTEQQNPVFSPDVIHVCMNKSLIKF